LDVISAFINKKLAPKLTNLGAIFLIFTPLTANAGMLTVPLPAHLKNNCKIYHRFINYIALIKNLSSKVQELSESSSSSNAPNFEDEQVKLCIFFFK
jgi:hypothetical protein